MAEEDLEMIYEEASEAMEKSVKSYRKDLLRVRTGRASTALLDGIMVDYYGTSTPLNQLANLSAPDPRLLVVAAFDTGALNDIETANDGMERLADLLDEERAVVGVAIRKPTKMQREQGYTDDRNAVKSYANASEREGEDL